MILVVDDEEYVTRLAEAILTRDGYDVIVARTGHAALEAVKSQKGKVSVALLDVRMPDIDGISLLPMLRQADPKIKVILTSGYIGENVLSLFEDVDFLQKPYNVDRLTTAVQSAIGRA